VVLISTVAGHNVAGMLTALHRDMFTWDNKICADQSRFRTTHDAEYSEASRSAPPGGCGTQPIGLLNRAGGFAVRAVPGSSAALLQDL